VANNVETCSILSPHVPFTCRSRCLPCTKIVKTTYRCCRFPLLSRLNKTHVIDFITLIPSNN
jgi:hypothetical protein